MDKRISRDSLNLAIAHMVSLRGTCERASVGCVICQEGRVVSTGYVGSPSKTPHCTDAGCIIGPDGGCIRTSHAEAGAIAFAARKGVALEGSTLYTTLSPCLSCAKLIVNSGISRVVYQQKYRDESGLALLKQAGVIVCGLNDLKVLCDLDCPDLTGDCGVGAPEDHDVSYFCNAAEDYPKRIRKGQPCYRFMALTKDMR